MRSFVDLLEELDPFSLLIAKQSQSEDECRKAVICFRFFGEWLHGMPCRGPDLVNEALPAKMPA